MTKELNDKISVLSKRVSKLSSDHKSIINSDLGTGLKSLNSIHSEIQQAISEFFVEFEDLKAYVDKLKFQHDEAMRQNHELWNLLKRTKDVQEHPGFTQVAQTSQNDSEMQSLKEAVAAMQKQLNEKNDE